MTVDTFRFQPACFVGDPTHRLTVKWILAKADDIHWKRNNGSQYIPECMKNPEWAQAYVYFGVKLVSGPQWVKVFSNN